MKAKIKSLKFIDSLIGQYVPPTENGHAGRAVEVLLERMGVPINRGHGPDVLVFGLEIKTRDVDAVSPQTIADMSLDSIIGTPYSASHVCEKFQQQLRVYVKNQRIISAKIYDFSLPHIQHKIELAYEHARTQLTNHPYLESTSCKGKYFGYFEKCVGKNTYSFRLTPQHFIDIENMSTSNFKQLYEYV
jgi:hypothetical protein